MSWRGWVFVVAVGAVGCGPDASVDRWDPIAPIAAARDAGTEGDGRRDLSAAAPEEASPTAAGDALASEAAPAPPDVPGSSVAAPEPRPTVDAALPEGPVEVLAPVDAAIERSVDGAAELRTDATEPACAPGTCKRVFVTAAATLHGGFGGASGADALCQQAAEAAGLAGVWRAWLSDALSTPVARFTRPGLPYRLLDGTLVAVSFAALAAGTLAHPIDRFESGHAVAAGQVLEVWTGTTFSGVASPSTCGNWTNTSAGLPTGLVGLSSRSDRSWSEAYAQFCNRNDVHLYCFEQ